MLIGVDIGGTKCAVLLAERNGAILDRVECPTGTVGKMLAFFKEQSRQYARCYPVEAVGISCGGPIDSRQGLIMSPPNLPGWDAIPICHHLEDAVGAPTFLQNDANASALAEWQYGAGRGTKNMIFLTFGTGMGAGLILNGQLYEGTNGNAGEVGHVRLAQDGPVGYGKIGSFEGFCSGGGIALLGKARAAHALEEGHPFAFAPDEGAIAVLSAKTIAQAAQSGDGNAAAIYAESGRKLGCGLALLLDILNPECIVIGSVFTRAGALMRREMEAAIKREALPQTAEVCRIVPAQLGDQIGDYAALATARAGLGEEYV